MSLNRSVQKFLAITVCLIMAAYLLGLIANDFPSSSLWAEILNFASQLIWSAALIASCYAVNVHYFRRSRDPDFQKRLRENKRHPLAFYGMGLIFLSFVWAGVTTKVVDPNAVLSIFIVFGGALVLSSVGFALIIFRVWQNLKKHLDQRDDD